MVTKELDRLNLSNQSISEEDIEENIEPSFLPKKKYRMYPSFQLNLDLTNKGSDEEEFEEIDEELNDKL
ncbi:17135_t:CDS:1, partial [Dentiscutata heterogama]